MKFVQVLTAAMFGVAMMMDQVSGRKSEHHHPLILLSDVKKGNNKKVVNSRDLGDGVGAAFVFGQQLETNVCSFHDLVSDINATRCENLNPLDLGNQDGCCMSGSDYQTCRSIGTDKPYCNATSEACDLSGDTLVIDIDIYTDDYEDNVCCRSCQCFGDPECQSFNGTWVEWVECDGREIVSGQCQFTENACDSQLDHAGNKCVWNTAQPYWNYKFGSPCQPDFAVSGYATMVMYESASGQFKANLTLAERASIVWANFSTTLGYYTLNAEACFAAGTENRAAAWSGVEPPSSWNVTEAGSKDYSDLRYIWSIYDPVEKVEVQVECAALWHNEKPGTKRLDIAFLRTQNMVQSDSGSGFCVTANIPEMQNANPDSSTLDQLCWANITTNDLCYNLMGNTCSDSSACATCAKQWCEVANYDTNECITTVEQGGVEGWITVYAKTIAPIAQQNYNQIVVKLQQNALFLEMLVAAYGNGNQDDNIVCAPSLDVYVNKDDIPSCVDVIEIQYLSDADEYVTVFYIPANKPLCVGANKTISYAKYPELFEHPIRIHQCTANETCDLLRCNPVLGFDATIQYVSDHCTASPTRSPTMDPTVSPTHSPTERPTDLPTTSPTHSPTLNPTENPTSSPTHSPTLKPTENPTSSPTHSPTLKPTENPTSSPTHSPTLKPTENPTSSPTHSPTLKPTENPTSSPTHSPTLKPTENPTSSPTHSPTLKPTENPTPSPTTITASPTKSPTRTTGQPTPSPVITLPPSLRPTSPFNPGNLTCHLFGDPHVTCFEGDNFNIVSQGTGNTTYFMMYEMDTRFKLIGSLVKKQFAKNGLTQQVILTESMYVWYNNNWAAVVDYAHHCSPYLPNALSLASTNYFTELYYTFPTTDEFVLVNFTCAYDDQGVEQGMEVWLNKRDGATSNPLQYEKDQGYDGACVQCNGYVPYNGTLPGNGNTNNTIHINNSDSFNAPSSASSTKFQLTTVLLFLSTLLLMI